MILSIDDLPPRLAASLSPEEKVFIDDIEGRGLLPFAVTHHFASLAGPEQNDPIRRQFIPDPREALPDPHALDDPLGEALYRKTPRLIHQYKDRALLLAGGLCAGYCRHCFRRKRQAAPQSFITGAELPPVCAYLKDHPEIKELLVSGGDPLTAANDELDRLFTGLREARPDLLLRLCTRAPVTAPERLTDGETPGELRELLLRHRPLRAAIHLNHPRELAEKTRRGLETWAAAGIPILVQTVLLRGINDNAETLAELFRECAGLGFRPYYLFQLDLAPGTAHFRVPLRQGLHLYDELKKQVPKAALPVYAVDLPGGGGKIALNDDSIAGEKTEKGRQQLLLRGPDGRLWPYPAA
ncbi:KamA family radical SAM protein [Spirochaetia bacterium]|nr:KamA family radical SAM protein [Spirochaetia bacterium]